MTTMYLNSKTVFCKDGFQKLYLALELLFDSKKTYQSAFIIADKFLASNEEFHDLVTKLKNSSVLYYDINTEPTTEYLDSLKLSVLQNSPHVGVVVGIGGGSVLDTAKALSNLLGNPGKAADYQGWDLLPKPGIYKIGVPTLFGTGSETSRTCVLLNKTRNLKLGMNSQFSLFDELIIDSSLSLNCPDNVWALTAMDGFFHALEILEGITRIDIADEFASTSKRLIQEGLMMPINNKASAAEKIALGSYFGGMALANGTVGLVHPFSAALSVVFGISHGLANCMAMSELKHYYPSAEKFFETVSIRYNLVDMYYKAPSLSDEILDRLIKSTFVHTKPIENHLGKNWEILLTPNIARDIFKKILN